MCWLETRLLILLNLLALTLPRRYNIDCNHKKEPQYVSQRKLQL